MRSRAFSGRHGTRPWAEMLVACALVALSAATRAQDVFSAQQLARLSLEDLANLQITSVSRREQSVSSAPASIYVITSDDIRRSGATTLPELLRLAPNLQVARLDSVQYAISARGFNNSVGNKLLVLLDGRTLYTPLFSGVFWDMEDSFLDDIERIEVISGVGATLWGANAVNGVINIITRSAADTQGLLLNASGGDREHGAAVRIGGVLGAASVRAYAKARTWDNTNLENGSDAGDSWNKAQAGFRADWMRGRDTFTLQGDVFDGESDTRHFAGFRSIIPAAGLPPVAIAGSNLLARWSRPLANASSLRVQAYWAHSERDDLLVFSPESDIIDLEFQHDLAVGAHRLVWGGGYRKAHDEVDPGLLTRFIPARRRLDWENIYLQDEIQLDTNLRLTAGVRLEWNDYTGLEYLPSVRLAFTPHTDHTVWLATSRAVRAPSRLDRDAYLPQAQPYIVAGGPNFVSEVAKVVSLGYRGQLSARLNLAATLFHHDWDNLRSGTPLPLPSLLANDIEGESYGVESWLTWQAHTSWRISGGLNVLEKELRYRPGGGGLFGPDHSSLHNDPEFQWTLRSSIDLVPELALDLNLRRVGALTAEPVPAYTELNARLAWYVLPQIELALSGRNLLDNDHAEYGNVRVRSRIDRSALLELRWTY